MVVLRVHREHDKDTTVTGGRKRTGETAEGGRGNRTLVTVLSYLPLRVVLEEERSVLSSVKSTQRPRRGHHDTSRIKRCCSLVTA